MASKKKVILEKITQDFVKALEAKGGEPLYKLTPPKAREVLEEAQAGPIKKPDVKVEELSIEGPNGDVSIRIMRPFRSNGELPVMMFFHGAGWMLGSPATHDRLCRELVEGTNAALVFVDYKRSPEAKFPQAIEEAYAATKYISENGVKHSLDTSRMVVVGDSVGGNMTIAVTMKAKENKNPKILAQVLFYPVTNGELTSGSYQEFADGPWLTKPAMEWFWNNYLPDLTIRKEPLASPLNASIEQLKGLPPALIITDENDVLRDEGEAYASKLMEAEVPVTAVRYIGTIHDFVMLNALANSKATRSAIDLAISFIKQALHT